MNNNLPAFPCASSLHGEPNTGLTKRELIATMVLQGCYSNSYDGNHEFFAELAIKATDTLLQALNETSSPDDNLSNGRRFMTTNKKTGKREEVQFENLPEEEQDNILRNSSKAWVDNLCKQLAKDLKTKL